MKTDFPTASAGTSHAPSAAVEKSHSASHTEIRTLPGSPMKGETMLATMQRLGVAHSRSRPSVSNDNPYSESLFKTLKYRPQFPLTAFEDLLLARRWVTAWVRWYNEEHRHSAIRFVTPNERHAQLDEKLLQARSEVYESARRENPLRRSGQTRDWGFIGKRLATPP